MSIKEIILEFERNVRVDSKHEYIISPNVDRKKYALLCNDIKNKFPSISDYLDPDLFIRIEKTSEGSFFRSERLWEQTMVFYEDVLLILRNVETTGSSPEPQFLFLIRYTDIKKVNIAKSIKFYNGLVEDGEHDCLDLWLDMRTVESYNDDDQIKYLKEKNAIDGYHLRLPNFVIPIDKIQEAFLSLLKKISKEKIDHQDESIKIKNQYFNDILSNQEISKEDIEKFKIEFPDELSAINLLNALFYQVQEDIDKARSSFKSILRTIETDNHEIEHLYDIFHKSYINFNKENKNFDDQIRYIESLLEVEYPDVDLEEILKNTKLEQALNNFDNNDNNKQELLIVNDEDINEKTSSFITLNKSYIPSNLRFPPGHPKPDTTYVRHPILDDKFLSIQDYEQELFKDKVSEFFLLIQALGAVEIQYVTIDDRHTKEKKNKDSDIESAIKTRAIDAQVTINSTDKSLKETFNNSGYNRMQKHDPQEKPYIPANLIWFHHNSDWQKLAEQRLFGNLLEHTEEISLSESSTLGSLNQVKISADIKNLFAGVNTNIQNNVEKSIKNSSSSRTIVHIKFKPKSEFMELENISNSSTKAITKQNVFNLFESYASQNGGLSIEGEQIFKMLSSYLNIEEKTIANFLNLYSIKK